MLLWVFWYFYFFLYFVRGFWILFSFLFELRNFRLGFGLQQCFLKKNYVWRFFFPLAVTVDRRKEKGDLWKLGFQLRFRQCWLSLEMEKKKRSCRKGALLLMHIVCCRKLQFRSIFNFVSQWVLEFFLGWNMVCHRMARIHNWKWFSDILWGEIIHGWKFMSGAAHVPPVCVVVCVPWIIHGTEKFFCSWLGVVAFDAGLHQVLELEGMMDNDPVNQVAATESAAAAASSASQVKIGCCSFIVTF